MQSDKVFHMHLMNSEGVPMIFAPCICQGWASNEGVGGSMASGIARAMEANATWEVRRGRPWVARP